MDTRIDLLGLRSADFVQAAAREAIPAAGIAGALYARAFDRGLLEPEAFAVSSSALRAWHERFSVGLLDVLEVQEEPGEHGLTAKALLSAADGSRIECVRVPMPAKPGLPPKSTLCISSQVGCRMGCAFCETGRTGLKRNLSAAEIVSQFVTTRLRLGWNTRNIVFMGMGEPLDNLSSVAAALRVFNDSRGPGMAWERITVCSSGPQGGIEALRDLGLKRLNLSISLNAGTDATRSALMPVNGDGGIAALERAAAAYPQRRNFILGVNYCLIPGVNDTPAEARGVARFCSSVGRCIVNLIPYNPGSSPLAAAPTEEQIEGFAAWLREGGCDVRRRARKGGSIMAACGQLSSNS